MKIFNSLPCNAAIFPSTAVAVGNFDGVHIGHQKIIDKLRHAAGGNNIPSVILTFFPHPSQIIGKGDFKLIQTREQKLETLASLGVDATVVLPFTPLLAGLSSREFALNIIKQKLNGRIVMVGENFRFGKGRQGDIRTIEKLGIEFKFEVISIKSLRKEGKTISSSLIRELLQQGSLEHSNHLLGRPYEIEGTVIRGDSRGKILGYPTANIHTPNEIIPSGVFITRVILGKQTLPSLTNCGNRPTFSKKCRQIETHILDFADNLYSQPLKVQFLKKIREEFRFERPEQLINQIGQDVEAAREYFAKNPTPDPK